jgi:hypothetical protein
VTAPPAVSLSIRQRGHGLPKRRDCSRTAQQYLGPPLSKSSLGRSRLRRDAAALIAPSYKIAEQLGNVDRTIFLLEWISNQPMRQEVAAMTNKVESYHSFSKWLRFGGEVIAENDPDEQQKYLRYICWPRP